MEDASSETVILTDISTDILCCMNAIATPSHCPDELAGCCFGAAAAYVSFTPAASEEETRIASQYCFACKTVTLAALPVLPAHIAF